MWYLFRVGLFVNFRIYDGRHHSILHLGIYLFLLATENCLAHKINNSGTDPGAFSDVATLVYCFIASEDMLCDTCQTLNHIIYVLLCE